MNPEVAKDPYVDSRLRSNKPTNYMGFIDELRRLWQLAGKEGDFKRHEPIKEDMALPRISYRKIHRTVNTSFKDIKPRHRATIRHPYREGEWVELRGQIFDVVVEFNVYSASAEQADEMIEELDEFLLLYKGFFKMNGVQEITFLQQLPDTVITDFRFPIACRPIQYTMRFEKIMPLFLNQIQQMMVEAQVVQPQEVSKEDE
ncbi:hypothetical protein GZH47_32720 (plasmid) [Paenibacillus rhizovicinus]|uniref:Uncharacterized protein n=1 Tax=Paenibacillus rhizovicinus TaxID=2704463 RepID=A0A6C0PCI3_9BACL|nr:hypothetical protein [Paenibacillus rhizovicinus]QHW35663.1 hypothetical protein GZH47_32720 [Paenibacillus rhizovicinus]